MVKLATTQLQSMVSKAIKGCSNNKMLPMTSIMAIQLKDGKLTLITTDMTNYLYVSGDVSAEEDFYATVRADIMAKFIASLTSENVIFEMTDKYLEVQGNGDYKIDLVLDDGGTMVEFPTFEPCKKKIGTVSMSKIQTILTTLKPALSKDVVTPCYTNYFVGDSVIATNMNIINMMGEKLFEKAKKPLFISTELMDLIGLCSSDTVEIRNDGDNFDVISDTVQIHSTLFEYTDQYQTDDINGVIEFEYPSTCQIKKNTLLQTLDRIMLFIDDEFSDGVANLKFDKNGLTIESTLSNGSETIEYVSAEHKEDFECVISAISLKEQAKSFATDNLTICYGREDAIKIVEDNIMSCIGLVVEE